jgi:hypothetical protein
MTQNTRFESNLISCTNGEKSFKVTYTELKTDMVVNFQKNDEVEISFDITNLQEDELYFEQKFAKYKLNLRKLTAIETNNGEKLVYKCSLKSFKM